MLRCIRRERFRPHGNVRHDPSVTRELAMVTFACGFEVSEQLLTHALGGLEFVLQLSNAQTAIPKQRFEACNICGSFVRSLFGILQARSRVLDTLCERGALGLDMFGVGESFAQFRELLRDRRAFFFGTLGARDRFAQLRELLRGRRAFFFGTRRVRECFTHIFELLLGVDKARFRAHHLSFKRNNPVFAAIQITAELHDLPIRFFFFFGLRGAESRVKPLRFEPCQPFDGTALGAS